LSNTSGVSKDPFILTHNNNELYVFFSDNTGPSNFDIRYRHWDGANWLAESLATSTSGNSYLPFAVSDLVGQIHLFWVDSTDGNFEIYYKKFSPDSGWSEDTNLSQTLLPSSYPTASLDDAGNIYLFWQELDEIYGKIKDHQIGWFDSQNISNTPTGSSYPSSSYGCDLIWTEGDTTPYNIIYYTETIPDTTPPQFIITSPSICYIGDTLFVVFSSNEILNDTPAVWLKDGVGDSLQFAVNKYSELSCSTWVYVVGLKKGEGFFSIRAEDPFGNISDTTCAISIASRGELLPRDSCFAFPNPTRKDYVKFMFYLNQNAHLKIDIFTLAGRKIYTFIDNDYEGGRLYEEIMSVKNLGSDIYIFRATAQAGDERATVTKKFGVIK